MEKYRTSCRKEIDAFIERLEKNPDMLNDPTINAEIQSILDRYNLHERRHEWLTACNTKLPPNMRDACRSAVLRAVDGSEEELQAS